MRAKDPQPVSNQRVLVVEDMDDARTSLQQLLAMTLKLEVDTAEDGAAGLKKLLERSYSVVVTDLKMPKLSGMGLIEEVHKRRLPVTVIITTGHGSISEAVQAMRAGAYEFLTKPTNPQHLCLLVERALSERALRDEVAALRDQLQERFSFRNVLSKSKRMLEVFELISNVADTNSTVLIVGETGTGKEMIARAVHDASPSRREEPLVALNCAALPETLLESELFGHEKGSFTGAAAQRKGRFEQANKGTLFLDEVGDVPMSMQVKLLRVLQERRIERVGSTEPIDIDVRVVAATNRPLEKLVAEGKFREDLYYRLNVVRIDLPPLRDRSEDIPLLAQHFVSKYARPNQPPPEISADAMDVLLTCRWPGNVRQLENAIERACVTAKEGTILPENLPTDVGGKSRTGEVTVDLSRPLAEQVSEMTSRFEEQYLRAALKKTNGHVGQCTELSGLSRRSVTEKLAHFNIDHKDYKAGEGTD